VRFAIVTDAERDAVDAAAPARMRWSQGGLPWAITGRADERRFCGRWGRVVLTPRRRRQVSGGLSAQPGADNALIRWRRWQESPIAGRARRKPPFACGHAGLPDLRPLPVAQYATPDAAKRVPALAARMRNRTTSSASCWQSAAWSAPPPVAGRRIALCNCAGRDSPGANRSPSSNWATGWCRIRTAFSAALECCAAGSF